MLVLARLAVRFVPPVRLFAWADRPPRRIRRFAGDEASWVSWAIEDLGGRLEDTIMTRVYVSDVASIESVAVIHGEFFRDIRPATTIVQVNFIDTRIQVEAEVAYRVTRQLAHEEGLFVGFSAGAAMYAAVKVARTLSEGVVVVILPDAGDKYLSTGLFK